MRDRLIEKLDLFMQDELGTKFREDILEHCADYLLENGVIAPPCKVGDTVYQVTRSFISEFRVRFIEISTCGNLFLHTDLINGIVHTGEIFSESEIGKTVFLAEEEAVQALKGGVQE